MTMIAAAPATMAGLNVSEMPAIVAVDVPRLTRF